MHSLISVYSYLCGVNMRQEKGRHHHCSEERGWSLCARLLQLRSQGLSSPHPGSEGRPRMKDPGNEVEASKQWRL